MKIKKQNKLISLLISLFIVLCFNLLFLVQSAKAQSAISLSITPPILEVTIMPGKEVRQTYILENNGGDVVLTPRIVYFDTSDENGNISLTGIKAPEWVKYDQEPFTLKFEDQKSFNVVINPPEDETEIDHNLTLVFESKKAVDLTNQTSSFYTSEIGSNILVTISKDGNPKKSAEILEFSSPKVVDSIFNKINYKVRLKNSGNSFWKPNGKIIVSDKQIKLAPFNILSDKSRKISCINDEVLKNCELDSSFLIGKIVSKLEFTIDDDPKIYKSETITYALPFSPIAFVLILLTLYRSRGIVRVWQKRK